MTSRLAMPWGIQYKQAGHSGRKRLHPMSTRLLLVNVSRVWVYYLKLCSEELRGDDMLRGAATTETSRNY